MDGVKKIKQCGLTEMGGWLPAAALVPLLLTDI
jgi:hypothetical protein